MMFHLVCRDCADLEELYADEDGADAHRDAWDHVEENPDHTATFAEVA